MRGGWTDEEWDHRNRAASAFDELMDVPLSKLTVGELKFILSIERSMIGYNDWDDLDKILELWRETR